MLSGDCNVCVNSKLPSYSATCVECGLSRKNYKPQTNGDRIRSMSDEELAEMFERWVVDCGCNNVPCEKVCEERRSEYQQISCRQCWLEWLRQGV